MPLIMTTPFYQQIISAGYWYALTGETADADYGYNCKVTNDAIYMVGQTTDNTFGGIAVGTIVKLAKTGDFVFAKKLDGFFDVYFRNVDVDSSGNIYLAGSGFALDSNGLQDFMLVKLDSAGDPVWYRALGGLVGEQNIGMTVAASGNIYMCGYFGTASGLSNELAIAKYDSSGNLVWQRQLGSSAVEYTLLSNIAVDSSENVYIVGYTTTGPISGNDVIVAKYNSSGTIQWQTAIGGTITENDANLTIDSSGNVYVIGGTTSIGAGGIDMFIAKFNTSGTLVWQRVLGGAASDFQPAIATNGTDVFIVGRTGSEGAGANDIIIARYDSDGNIQWQRLFGSTGNDYGYTVAIDGTAFVVSGSTFNTISQQIVIRLPIDGSLTGTYGDYTYAVGSLAEAAATLSTAAGGLTDSAGSLVSISLATSPSIIGLHSAIQDLSSGSTRSLIVDGSGNLYRVAYTAAEGQGSLDALIQKYNSSLVGQWQELLGGSGNDYAYGVALDASENPVIVGSTFSEGAGNFDAYVAKFNTSGTLQWQRRLGGGSGDHFYGVISDSSSNLYCVGATASQGAGGNEGLLAKYNSSGTFQWHRTIGTGQNDYFTCVAIDSTYSNVYIGGYSNDTGGFGNWDGTLTKVNSSGTFQWQKKMGKANADVVYDVVVEGTTAIYVILETYSIGPSNTNVGCALIKFDVNGNIQWQRALYGDLAPSGKRGVLDGSGNIFVAGSYFVAKYATNGNLTWKKYLPFQVQGLAYSSGYIYLTSNRHTYKIADTGAGLIDGTMFTAENSSLSIGNITPTVTTTALTEAAATLTNASGTRAVTVRDLKDTLEVSTWSPTHSKITIS